MTLQAITPTRILDTRTANGGHPLAFFAGEDYALPVLGRGAVPSYGVAAVMANVTVIPGSVDGGYITVFPTGPPRPLASNLNFIKAPGPIVTNQVFVGLGVGGTISIFCSAPGAQVIVDINGWVPAAPTTAAGPTVPLPVVPATAPDTVKAEAILANAVRYLRDTWWAGTGQTLLAAPVDQTGPPSSQDAVRRMGMAAVALTTAHTIGAATDLTMAATFVDRVASTHFVHQSGGWGEGWQTPLWAGLLGRAAWFMWADLPDPIQRRVAAVVEHEANFAIRQHVHYLRDPAGTVLTAGDSGAEEVAWQASPLQVALVMLPNHPLRDVWLAHLVQFSLAAWARPADVASSTVVNGAALSSWLGGSNVEADGTVVNHNRTAPDYATTLYQNLDAEPLHAQAGQIPPRALVALLAPVYAALTTFYDAAGVVSYPQGNDWGTGQVLPFALADALALTYGFDNGTAAGFLGLHLDAVLAQQARHADGHTYEPAEYTYEGAEEHAAQLAAQTVLALCMRDHDLAAFSDTSCWIG